MKGTKVKSRSRQWQSSAVFSSMFSLINEKNKTTLEFKGSAFNHWLALLTNSLFCYSHEWRKSKRDIVQNKRKVCVTILWYRSEYFSTLYFFMHSEVSDWPKTGGKKMLLLLCLVSRDRERSRGRAWSLIVAKGEGIIIFFLQGREPMMLGGK